MLRKRLGEKKSMRTLKRIACTEKCKVNDIVHKASRDIVNEAKAQNSVIVVGSPDGEAIRRKAKGRRFNRIVHSRAFDKLTRFIEYKAFWDGVPVVRMNEAYTSTLCHVCNGEVKRPHQGLVHCASCGFEGNADYNTALNIAKRSWKHIFKDGAVGFRPISQPTTENYTELASLSRSPTLN